MKEFIVEKVEDLAFDKNECPLSVEVKRICLQYSNNNLILDNGQMVCLNYTDQVRDKIFDYCQKTLMEFIESERKLNKCYEIKNKYISKVDNINNTSSYVKSIFDIIVNMDRVYKYLWNISKTLVDDIGSYKEYVSWQEKTTNIKKEFKERWNLIYDIRNEIEHPKNLKTTSFARVNGEAVIPQIIYDGKRYDLLEIANNSLQCVYVFFKAIMGASFLYSKYVIAFTDESRKIMYRGDKV